MILLLLATEVCTGGATADAKTVAFSCRGFVAQMLRKAPCGTRSVLWQPEKVAQIGDQHADTRYRRTAAAFLRTARRWLCYDHDS